MLGPIFGSVYGVSYVPTAETIALAALYVGIASSPRSILKNSRAEGGSAANA